MSVDACPAGSPPTDTALVGARFRATSGLSLKRQGKGLRGARGNAEAPHSEAYITNQYLVKYQITYTVPLLLCPSARVSTRVPIQVHARDAARVLLELFRTIIRVSLGFPSDSRMRARMPTLIERRVVVLR